MEEGCRTDPGVTGIAWNLPVEPVLWLLFVMRIRLACKNAKVGQNCCMPKLGAQYGAEKSAFGLLTREWRDHGCLRSLTTAASAMHTSCLKGMHGHIKSKGIKLYWTKTNAIGRYKLLS